MRSLLTVGLLSLAALAAPVKSEAQTTGHLNPMITLHEKKLPVFGIGHPGILSRGGGGGGGGGRGAGRGGGGAAAAAAAAAGGATTTGGAVAATTAAAPPATPAVPPTPIVIADVAKATVAYKLADFNFTSGTSDAFLEYMREIKTAGGSMSTHPFVSKIPQWARNPEAAAAATTRQLNAGQVGIMMQAIESPEELRAGIAAMRFTSAGGTRPDTGIDAAAAYWGVTPAQYRQKADVWPLNKNGDLIVWAIIESTVGIDRVRDIAKEPGLGVLWVGWGTLLNVMNNDQVAREAVAQKVLAACKEFSVPCGFPTNNPAEITARMAEGWSVFVMQQRNENGFGAIETGRKLSGR